MSDYRVGNRQITNASYRSPKQPLSGEEEAQIKKAGDTAYNQNMLYGATAFTGIGLASGATATYLNREWALEKSGIFQEKAIATLNTALTEEQKNRLTKNRFTNLTDVNIYSEGTNIHYAKDKNTMFNYFSDYCVKNNLELDASDVKIREADRAISFEISKAKEAGKTFLKEGTNRATAISQVDRKWHTGLKGGALVAGAIIGTGLLWSHLHTSTIAKNKQASVRNDLQLAPHEEDTKA
ncbi:MAG: hypothetical protein H2174_07640 [Vampirovibrio sp.]|nr:hypothetical protein [Vampirovibrio sp.]